MVIDFGNSRTGVLLLELAGEISQTPQMLPFELVNRYHLDAWNEEGEHDQRAGGPLVLLEDPLVQHALPAAACSRRRPSTTPWATRTPSGGWFGRGKQAPPGQGRSGRHAAAVRRPLDGPHGPRGRRRGAGHAGRGRHPHRRQLAQALPVGRRRQLAGRGQLAHGRSGRPLQDGRLRLAAEGPVPPLRPRGRPRFPAPGRRAEGERVRHRVAAEAAARPARADDRRALRDALPGLHLRQLAGLPHRLGRGRPGPRNPHPHAQLSQRHDPGGAAPLRRPGQQGDQHLRRDAGQEPALQAGAEPGHRRGQRRAT